MVLGCAESNSFLWRYQLIKRMFIRIVPSEKSLTKNQYRMEFPWYVSSKFAENVAVCVVTTSAAALDLGFKVLLRKFYLKACVVWGDTDIFVPAPAGQRKMQERKMERNTR